MSDSKTPLRPWVHGLFAATITGLGNGITLALASAAFDIFKDFKGLATATITTTLVSVAAYLKQSPLPYYDFEGGEVKSPVLSVNKATLLVLMAMCLPSCVLNTSGRVDIPATTQNAAPYLRPAASAIGVGLLLVTKDNESKEERAKWLFTVATIIHPFGSDIAPSVEKMREALMFITPQSTDDLVQVVISVSGLYASVRERLGSDTKAILFALEQIALGLEDAASPYVKVKGS